MTLTKKPPAAARRRLVLVDIENLAAVEPRLLRGAQIQSLSRSVRDRLGTVASDHVVVASNPRWTPHLSPCWPEALIRARGGPDGADIALCEHATRQRLEQFKYVWILSGDGRFAATAALARSLGITITVMTPPCGLSRRLEREAHEVISFKWRLSTSPRNERAA